MLETGSEGLDDRLQTITGWLADQGTEIKIGDAPRLRGGLFETCDRLASNDLTWDAAEVGGGDNVEA